jgi:hypothetical protein
MENREPSVVVCDPISRDDAMQALGTSDIHLNAVLLRSPSPSIVQRKLVEPSHHRKTIDRMPPKRRKAPPKGATGEKPSKRKAIEKANPEKESPIDIHELYSQCVLDGPEAQRLDKIKEWEERGAVAEIVWPFLVANLESKQFFHGCHLLVLFLAHQYWEGSFGGSSSTLDAFQDEITIAQVLETLFYKTDQKDYLLQTQIVNFLIVALASNNTQLHTAVRKHVGGVGLLHWTPERRRELELRKSAGLRRKFADSPKTPLWIVANTHHVLNLLEGHSEHGLLVKIVTETKTTAEERTMGVPLDVWNFLHRSLELLIDVLSVTNSRLFLVTYLDAIHFSVRCRLAVGNKFAIPENLRLVQHLLARINGLLAFPIDDSTQKHLSKVDVVSMHHDRATILQKMAYRHYPRDLQQVIYAGVGLLCAGQQKNSYLARSFVGFSDDDLHQLVFKLRLIQEDDKSVTRDFMLQVLGNHLSIPPYPMDQLKAFSLYPTEFMLWDHSVIPPSSSQLRGTQVLALPKLNSRFLSFQDYLLRNFELLRLESAYDIRGDLVNVVKRVQPLLRQSNLEESEEQIQLKTEFNGWSRMALEMVQPLDILEVQPPNLGDTVSSRVLAEIVIDLEACGDSIRREWDAIGEYDNLFLLAIDASKMSGNQAPLLKDYHLRHMEHKMWDSDSERRVPDEEDSTFPQRFGVTLVRGCMVLQVRNGQGTILSEPGAQIPDKEKNNTKRIFKVAMDAAQYAIDSKSPTGTGIYQVRYGPIIIEKY